MEKEKILSILIPAYNYVQGIDILLQSINYRDEIEIVVYDDSDNENINKILQKYRLEGLPIKYKKNINKSAVNNWNNLLDDASGKYSLLIHHDEYFLLKNSVDRILYLLQEDKYDVIVLRCLLLNNSSLFLKQKYHMPLWLQKNVVRYFPEYLFLRNVLGPPSLLIVRSKFYPRYDIKLKWKVDVDLYYRLAKQKLAWYWADSIIVCSVMNCEYSITNSIKENIKKTIKFENIYIKEKYRLISIDYAINSVTRIIENFFWITFRIYYYLIYIRLYRIN